MAKSKFVLLLAIVLSFCISCSPKPDHTGFYQEIKSADKMVFASMSITKTAKIDSKDWYKIGKRIAVYSYDTYLQAYINLSELKPEDLEFNDNDKSAIINLPPISTEISGRDFDMRKEYENIGLLRHELDSKERAEIKEKANADLMKELKSNPAFEQRLKEEAAKKAVSYFETLFEEAGYKAQVRFK